MKPWIFVAVVVSEVVLVAIYVIVVIADVDVSSYATALRFAVVVGAGIIAGAAFQTWQRSPSGVRLAAMAVSLLGGGALASTATSSLVPDGGVYASNAVAVLGTASLVLAAVVLQIARAQDREAAR